MPSFFDKNKPIFCKAKLLKRWYNKTSPFRLPYKPR